MEDISVGATSAGREDVRDPSPLWVRTRAETLLDLAAVKLLALSLIATATIQSAALAALVLAPPQLLYVPEVAP